jgi:hypothetical protein
MQAKVTAATAQTELLQEELNRKNILADKSKEEVEMQLNNLQNLLCGLKLPGRVHDSLDRELQEANLLDGLMPGCRDSVNMDVMSKGIEGRCLQAMRTEELVAVCFR